MRLMKSLGECNTTQCTALRIRHSSPPSMCRLEYMARHNIHAMGAGPRVNLLAKKGKAPRKHSSTVSGPTRVGSDFSSASIGSQLSMEGVDISPIVSPKEQLASQETDALPVYRAKQPAERPSLIVTEAFGEEATNPVPERVPLSPTLVSPTVASGNAHQATSSAASQQPVLSGCNMKKMLASEFQPTFAISYRRYMLNYCCD